MLRRLQVDCYEPGNLARRLYQNQSLGIYGAITVDYVYRLN